MAVLLAQFGIPSQFVTSLPKNDIGECATINLCKKGADTSEIVYGSNRLGIYFLETGAVSRGFMRIQTF